MGFLMARPPKDFAKLAGGTAALLSNGYSFSLSGVSTLRAMRCHRSCSQVRCQVNVWMMLATNLYALLADLVLIAHLAFVAFVVLGFILIWAGYFCGWSFVTN